MTRLSHLEVLGVRTKEKGVFAKGSFSAGETICAIHFDRIERAPERHSVQIGPAAHGIPMPEPLQSVNHSCDPNVFFDVDRRVLRALRAIEPGEELRYFYPSTEWEMAEPFDCDCGSVSCLGRVEGASRLSVEVLHRHELARHIRELIFC